jgi:hypothetical protein
MSKQWKLISASAALGLLMAAFFFIFVGLLPRRRRWHFVYRDAGSLSPFATFYFLQ